jgi:hypothetical protein
MRIEPPTVPPAELIIWAAVLAVLVAIVILTGGLCR